MNPSVFVALITVLGAMLISYAVLSRDTTGPTRSHLYLLGLALMIFSTTIKAIEHPNFLTIAAAVVIASTFILSLIFRNVVAAPIAAEPSTTDQS